MGPNKIPRTWNWVFLQVLVVVPTIFCTLAAATDEKDVLEKGNSAWRLEKSSRKQKRTQEPSIAPTQAPFFLTSPPPREITYIPGNLTTYKDLLWLSEGLDSKLIARSGFPVEYANQTLSNIPFHFLPDGAACFPDHREQNKDGWVYVSNAEVRSDGMGGVGAVTFDKDGKVTDYKMILEGTKSNCGGGKTPWGTWVSCEETSSGNIYQVDPFGVRPAERMTLGSEGGWWEAFAYDVRDKTTPRFYATEDQANGALARFTPTAPKWSNAQQSWKMLHNSGVTEYLILNPVGGNDTGTFSWTTNRESAKENAMSYYPSTEGIDAHENELYFVCKGIRMLYILDLDRGNYTRTSTESGLFGGTPDQIKRILKSDADVLYFNEDDLKSAGVHARDGQGRYMTILESPILLGETSGLAFSPNAKVMYVSYQTMGRLYAVWRRDGLPFYGTTLNVMYHQ